MNWQEMKKKAVDNGFVFLKHGSRHDIYVNKANGKNHFIGTSLVAGSAPRLDEQAEKGDRVLMPGFFFRNKQYMI